MDNIDILSSILRGMEHEGEKLARKITGILIDEQKSLLFQLNLREFEREISLLGQESKLTKTERDVMEFILGQKKPITRAEIIKKFSKTHKSLQYESHASIILNSIVRKGFLGRTRIEGIIYFMNPEEALLLAIKKMGKRIIDITTADDILKIYELTGMPKITIVSVLDELSCE